MRRLMMLALALVALFSVSVPFLTAQEEVATLAVLNVVDSDPLEGQEMGLNDSITLYFDRDVDCSTIEAAVSITPDVPGNWECLNSRLTFTPAEAYQRATVYTVTVGAEIRSTAGLEMAEPYMLELMTSGFLTVTETFPTNNSEAVVPTNTPVTVIFNRPVVPLVTSEDMPDLPQPLTFDPPVEGTGDWINTSIYVFKPAQRLPGGATFTVTVESGLTAVDSSFLNEDYTFQFSTESPLIDSYTPSPNSDEVRLDANIQVTFNQPMDRASTEAAFYLRVVETAPKLAGTFEWNNADTGFLFDPAERLLMDTIYEAGFFEGALGKGKVGHLTGIRDWAFSTVPFPAITSTDPFDGSTDAPPYGGFTMYFASPMNVETMKDKITIEPKPRRDPEFYYRDWNNSYSVNFPPEPGTTYTVNIAAGMEDAYGNVIDEPYSFSYTTRNYGSDMQLRVPGSVGFYNAYRAPTQLFLTHLNVDEIDLQLVRVPVQNFARTLVDGSYYERPQITEENILRNWTIENVAPRNVMRYELLEPGQLTAPNCSSALPSRLNVGDAAIVVNEPDALRARAEASTGSEIVELLYKDYALTITGGPVCSENLLWWEVELRENRTAWVVESFEGEYMLALNPAAGETPVTVTGDDGTLAPGIYYLTARAERANDTDFLRIGHYMVVSTAVVTLKASTEQATVWVTNVQTGEPVDGVPITFYKNDEQGEPVAGGVTDADGMLTVSIPRLRDLYSDLVAVLDDGEQFGMGVLDWTNGIEPWQFGVSYDFYPHDYVVYPYTDRPLYRPGQPVYFRAIIRAKEDVSYTVPDMTTVPVQILDDQGEIVFEEEIPLTPFGTISGEFNLADDAGLGYYYLRIDLPSRYEYQSEGGGISFTVAEYRLPEYEVEVTPVETQIVRGDTVKVDVAATYYFGGSVSNANVDYYVVSNPYSFNYTGDEYYDFYDNNYDGGPSDSYDYYGGQIASGSVVTDESGEITIEIPAELKDITTSQTFTIEATVSDESNQAVSGRTEVIVHKGLVYAGLRPLRYVSSANNETGFEIISVDWDSNPVPNQQVDVTIVERRWSSVQEMDESTGRTTWTWSVEEIPVTDGSVTTDSDGKATFNFTPPKGGVYKAIVETRDENGNDVKASTMMWVSSREYVSWRQQNSNRIDLIADKKSYSVGDTAEILITSPFQGEAEALITVERGRVIKTQRVTLTGNSYIYTLPIDDSHAPNVFVGVVIVKGVDENNPVAGFRMGYIQLGVDISRKEMHIDITSNVERAQPQQIVTYTVRTTDYKGDPVPAEVGVAVTDVAALALMPPNSGPMLPYFYGQQGLGVRTASPLTINTDQITQETLDTVKGGGGGGGGGGIVTIRGEFVDTPYWNGSVVTGEDGTATFDVRLPDNLTTWRLDARGLTAAPDGNLLLGQNTFELLSTKSLIIRPVTPRFFVVGDTVYLSAVINNNTPAAQETTVSLKGSGFTFVDDNAVQTVTVPADGRWRVQWQVVVEDVPFINTAFIAEAAEYNDASISPVSIDDNGTLPVYKYEVPETVGTSGVLRADDGSRLESIVLPRRFDVTQGELKITLEQSLASATLDGLTFLRQYPYYCIEQTVSRFLPNVMTLKALNDLGLPDDGLEVHLNIALSAALQKLYAEQKSDGGWGWFLADNSDTMVTAYALLGLSVAREEGYTISDSVIQGAQRFLQSNLIVASQGQSRWRMNRQAFVLYAMTRSGARDIARTVNLYENSGNLSLWAKGFLAQTLAIISPADTSRTDALLSDINSSIVISASGAHWVEGERDYYNWNTDLRTTAILLDTMIKLRPESNLLPQIVRYIMVQRTADAWETTQETAWSVMALTDWMVVSGELNPDYDYTVTLNDDELAGDSASSDTVRDKQEIIVDVSDLVKDEANNLLFERTTGAGALYYTAFLEAYLPVPQVEAFSRGITVDRHYYRPGSEEEVTEAVVGEVLQVRLTIVAPSSLHYVVIEDPLPAGMEGINPKLQTSQQIGTRPGLAESDTRRYGWGWWWFSQIEFRDEKVALYATYLPAGTYEYVYSVRAGVPGTYNVIPVTAQEFYFPDVYGRSNGSSFTILPEE